MSDGVISNNLAAQSAYTYKTGKTGKKSTKSRAKKDKKKKGGAQNTQLDVIQETVTSMAGGKQAAAANAVSKKA